jgi:phospholipid/cholesterol/gamma-HCH transport system substrate-binding protein
METRASYVLIGAFALAVVVGAVVFVLWLGKLSLDRQWDLYDVIFDEAVTGLGTGSAVQYNGIQVGEVRALSLSPTDPRRAVARIRVNAATPVKTDTHARLTFTGVTGVAIVQLTGGAPETPLLRSTVEEGVPVIVADTSAIQNLLSSGEGMVENVNELLQRLALLFRDENLEAFSGTLAHMETLSGTLAARDAEIDAAIADTAAAARSLAATLARSDALLTRLDGAAAEAERVFREDVPVVGASAREALEALRAASIGLDRTVAENRAAITDFANDGLAQVAPTLTELRETLRSLRGLADRLEQEPGLILAPTTEPREYAIP